MRLTKLPHSRVSSVSGWHKYTRRWREYLNTTPLKLTGNLRPDCRPFVLLIVRPSKYPMFRHPHLRAGGCMYTDLTFWPHFSRKRSENQWKNYLGNVLWMKGRSHAKIQAVLSNMKKRPTIRHKTVMFSALQFLCAFCLMSQFPFLILFTEFLFIYTVRLLV